MTRIASVGRALPARQYQQSEITELVAELVAPDGERRALLQRLHASTGVRARHLVLPLEAYAQIDGFRAANDAYIDAALELGEHAVRTALEPAGLTAADVDVLMTVSVTGLATPSIDARLAPRLGLRADVKRIPVFGLGCVAGAAGIARLHDVLAADPDGVAVLLAVEACSLTVQRHDPSTANLVASGLFGDGAAAVVLLGERRARSLRAVGPDVVATRSRLYPDTEEVMGWRIGGNGFQVVLAATVADVVEAHLGDDVRRLLGEHDLTPQDVARWIGHPGGPKVIEAAERALGLGPGVLDASRRSLAEVGNLSSASVLFVLADVLDQPAPPPGAPGVLFAMGPGFCSELVLLRWG